MNKITIEEFIEIMDDDTMKNWEGDNAYKGLQIIAKYTDNVVTGTSKDILFSERVDVLIVHGITKEDVIALMKLSWMIEEDNYLACFV
jgi:hypothetical protein